MTVVVGRLILVVGGSDVVEAFDIVSHTWSKLWDQLSICFYCAGGLVGDRVLIVGGVNPHGESLKSGV